MIEILLDGKHVVPKHGSSIKLTSQNPYFASSTTFTYEVELPMDIPNNRAALGWMNCADTPKPKTTLDAEMRMDNITILRGKASVVSVTEKAVKVQLLGARSAFNHESQRTAQYIDRLQLGTVGASGYEANPAPDNITTGDRGNHAITDLQWGEEAEYTDPEGRWLKYPVMNTNNNLVSNDYLLYRDKGGKTYKFGFPKNCAFNDPNVDDPRRRRAIQPKLWWIAELIAKATGFTLDRSDNILYSDGFFRRIFIANTYPHYKINTYLPHWTTAEFWRNLEQAFGLVVVMDEASDRMRIMPRTGFYANGAKRTDITEVVDEYTADVDDDENTDISTSNVSYGGTFANPCDRLDESVTQAARYDTSFSGIDDIKAWAKSIASFRIDNYLDTIFDCKDGRRYIIFKERLEGATAFMEVDQYRARITDPEKDSDQLELKFAPASYLEHEIRAVEKSRGDGRNPSRLYDVGTVKQEVIGCPGRTEDISYTNILEDIINGAEAGEQGSTEDVIYIAFENPGYWLMTGFVDGTEFSINYPQPLGRELTYWRIDEDTPMTAYDRYTLSLNKISGQVNMYTKTIEGAVKIDTATKFCFSFLTDKIIEPTGIFNIHNKLFVCEKIEYSIKDSYLGKLATGYFYPVEL